MAAGLRIPQTCRKSQDTTHATGLRVALPILAAGACAGFLYHNWHPARIVLGDSGVLVIGCARATASLVGSTKAPTLLINGIVLGLGVTMLIDYLSFFEKRRNSRDDN